MVKLETCLLKSKYLKENFLMELDAMCSALKLFARLLLTQVLSAELGKLFQWTVIKHLEY